MTLGTPEGLTPVTSQHAPLIAAPRRPARIQMTRQRPWRADHPDAVIVARPTKWGNPFAAKIPASDRGGPGEAGQATMTRQMLADEYREWLLVPTTKWANRPESAQGDTARTSLMGVPFAGRPTLDEIRADLAGRDLACWCPLDQPCHADVLLELANALAPCPECGAGKHANCDGTTWDAAADALTTCPCFAVTVERGEDHARRFGGDA